MMRVYRGIVPGLGFLLACVIVGTSDDLGAQPPKIDPEAIFRKADANDDGKLSKDEWKKFAEVAPKLKDNPKAGDFLFGRLDANKDGFIILDEFKRIGSFAPKGKDLPPKGEPKKDVSIEKPATAEQIAFFEKSIRPVLVAECYSCHSAEAPKVKGGLLLDTRDGLRKGGDTGPGLAPGNPAGSMLIKALKHANENLAMPPKKKLGDEVIADFEKWITMGAPDPRDGAATMIRNEIDIEKGRQFWAFQRPQAVPAPKVKNAAWATSEIDGYLLAKLEAKGLAPTDDADRSTLLRRVTIDLIGLPPTPDEIDAFLKDNTPNAFEKVVDRLLASPGFGERWGRHWLDVARYGETTGKTVNANYPHAWRYRDYVIAAFNADKPYDQFIREQLAGDLLPAKNDQQKAEQIIATGFLAIGTKSLNERNREQFQMDVVDEQIDATSQAFLGITAACARCHDHKFDPIPQKDYYALAGIFGSTETCYGTLRQIQAAHPSSLLALPAGAKVPNIAPLPAAERERIKSQIADMKKELAEMAKGDAKAPFLSMNGVRINIQMSQLESKLASYEQDGTPKASAMGVRERSAPRDMPVYLRGEVNRPGEIVHRGVLQVVSKEMPTIRAGSGRKELAEWITNDKNPLTARVMANRVWLHLFGRGLVPTADNFGASGQPPSHPELLDHLAISFMKNDWSVKKLIKRMMMTHAYRLDSRNSGEHFDIDPDNVLIWRMAPRKLDAEVLRDSILAVSGKLDPSPAVGSLVANFGEGLSGTLIRTTRDLDTNSNHRSVYLTIMRDNLPDSLALFDAADPSLVTAERNTTNVPSQGLFLLNNPWVMRMAESAGKEIFESAKTDEARVKYAYLKLFGREPTESESATALDFLRKFQATNTAVPKGNPPPKGPFGKGGFGPAQDNRPMGVWSAFAQALFASAEFQYKR